MTAILNATRGDLAADAYDADAAVRQLYSRYARALHRYVERFCPDLASTDDIVQETFIRPASFPAASPRPMPIGTAIVVIMTMTG